jgi:hypothetical protein
MKTADRAPSQTGDVQQQASGILQRKCACGQHTIAGTECPQCRGKKNDLQRQHTEHSLVMQPKLTVGASNDRLEQEADRVADQVLALSPHAAVGSTPPHIQRIAAQPAIEVDTAPASVDHVLSSLGTPLEPALQQDMGQRFGHDFSRVRVHSGPAAEQSALELNANAYTVGPNLVFGAGQFAPGTHEGRRLIAHELTHVVQQSASERTAAGLIARSPTINAGSLIQRSERDPDELAAMANEDEAIKARAKRALASDKPDFAVHEVMWRLIKNYGLDTHFELNSSRYDKAQKGVVVDLRGTGPRTTGSIVGGDEVLQRIAGGQAAQVAKEIEAQISKVDTARGAIDYVFLMGADAPKSNNKFYTEAKKFFQAEYPGATMIEDVRDLEGINKKINSEKKPVANLYIVSHAHPDGTLQFSIDPADTTPGQMQYSELKEANDKQSMTKPDPDLVGFWTNVMIRGCNLGRNQEMLLETRTAFGGDVRVIAPTHEQVYSGGKESMGGAFYEEPGVSKLSDEEAFKRIKAKPEYAFITDWDAMRSKLRRFNTSTPEIVYEGKFPAKGKELELLKSERGAKTATNYTVGPSRIEGTETVFTFTSNDPTKLGDIEIRQATPPEDAAAIELARKTVARPDAYAYNVRRLRSGLVLSVTVDIQRTEWELYHAEMKKKGKGFNPSAERPESKPWFGDTDN